jgi:hypothetical protein
VSDFGDSYADELERIETSKAAMSKSAFESVLPLAGSLGGAIAGSVGGYHLSSKMKSPSARIATQVGSGLLGSIAGSALGSRIGSAVRRGRRRAAAPEPHRQSPTHRPGPDSAKIHRIAEMYSLDPKFVARDLYDPRHPGALEYNAAFFSAYQKQRGGPGKVWDRNRWGTAGPAAPSVSQAKTAAYVSPEGEVLEPATSSRKKLLRALVAGGLVGSGVYVGSRYAVPSAMRALGVPVREPSKGTRRALSILSALTGTGAALAASEYVHGSQSRPGRILRKGRGKESKNRELAVGRQGHHPSLPPGRVLPDAGGGGSVPLRAGRRARKHGRGRKRNTPDRSVLDQYRYRGSTPRSDPQPRSIRIREPFS